jgi:8-oxo-dGTP pyrophosphatase MutT (NUDIX family)
MERQVPPDARRVFEGSYFAVDALRWRGLGGGWVEKEVVRHPGAVTVIPMLPDGRLVLIRNWRISIEAWLLEFCAGRLAPGEDPSAAAVRELAEETGYRAGRVVEIGRFFTSPGLGDELMRVYEAEHLEAGPPRLEADERIETVRLEPGEIEAMIRKGELVDGKTIAAWSLWRAHRGIRS